MNLHSLVYIDHPPNSYFSTPWHASSFHPGGVQTAFADGSVHFISDFIELDAFMAISTIAGREVVDGSKIGL
jgi:prepilin-type processing-associated H-X9-DG protein